MMTMNRIGDWPNMLAAVVVICLLIPTGCAQDAANSDADAKVRARGMRDLAETGDRQSIDALIDGLEDESESVRRQAQRGLSDTLKRKIYFDPSASREDRSQAVAGVRSMWQNLQERDLVEAVKERMPLKYFYDLNTGEVFEDLAGPGPIETPSGPYEGMPAGVCAVVVACSDCSDDADRYVGWLEIPAAVLRQHGISYETAGGLKQVKRAIRRPDGGDWALIGTPAAETITADARRCEQREIPMPCRPGR
jgi:hypothetical protein